MINGNPHFIGNHKRAHELGVCSLEVEAGLAEIESRGQSLAVLGHTPHEGCVGKVLGILAISDTLRPEVPEALRMLHAAGFEMDFHGSGNPSTTPIQHSALEIKEHHDGMALLMKREDGAKFLRDCASGHLGH